MNIVTWSDEVFEIAQTKDDEGKSIEGTGSEVKCRLRKLRSKDIATITPIMGEGRSNLEQIVALSEVEDVISRCTDLEQGITVDGELVAVDGNKVTAEDLANEVDFTTLAWGIVNKLIEKISLTKGDKGN